MKPLIQQINELPARSEVAELRVPVSLSEVRNRLGSGVTRLSVDLLAEGVAIVDPKADRRAVRPPKAPGTAQTETSNRTSVVPVPTASSPAKTAPAKPASK